MQIDRRVLFFFDWPSFFITLIIAVLGLLFVLSATYTPSVPYSIFFQKQLLGVISGIGIYAFFCISNPYGLQRWGYFLYFFIILLLMITLVKGSIGMGAQRWINLGIIKFQPSELSKLFFPAFFSYYVSTEKKTVRTVRDFLPVLLILGLSFLLILKQPDLGTALLILFSGVALLWLANIPHSFFIITACIGFMSMPVLWKCLKPYQKKRIMVFLGEGDARRERYQIEQSCIAIGSGGLTGKGYLKGTQNKLHFLPESRTDFIFSVICEEWGFVGACCVIVLFMLLIYRSFLIIASISHAHTQLLAAGLIIPIILSVLINIGMVLGLLPIVGIPLPLMSYGITHSWITFASLGWLNGIAARRF